MSAQEQTDSQGSQIETEAGEDGGASAPAATKYASNTSRAERLRCTDCRPDESAGWRTEMAAVPGVVPEGWRT